MVGEEEKRLYEKARAEGLDVYTPEQFYYYFHGPYAPQGHPYTGLTYSEYLERVRAAAAVRSLDAARLKRSCPAETPFESELRERAEQLSREKGVPFDIAREEALLQLKREGFAELAPGGGLIVKPVVELVTPAGVKRIPVPEEAREKGPEEQARWLFEQMKRYSAEAALVGRQRFSFEELKSVFEPPPPPTPQPVETRHYVAVMRAYGGREEKLEVPSFEEFVKSGLGRTELEYRAFILKRAKEAGYDLIKTGEGWVKVPDPWDIRVTAVEVPTAEGLKMVPLQVFKESVQSSLASTTLGTGSQAAAALKGFGVGLLSGVSLGLAERLVPSITAKLPVTPSTLAPPQPPARATDVGVVSALVERKAEKDIPELAAAREAYFTHQLAAIPGRMVGAYMLGKAVETWMKMPPAEEIARRYLKGEPITPQERLKMEAWLHTPEKLWKAAGKVGEKLFTGREVEYEVPREVEVSAARVGHYTGEREYFITTKVKSWQKVSPEEGEFLATLQGSEPIGWFPIKTPQGKTAIAPWVKEGTKVTAYGPGEELKLLNLGAEDIYGFSPLKALGTRDVSKILAVVRPLPGKSAAPVIREWREIPSELASVYGETFPAPVQVPGVKANVPSIEQVAALKKMQEVQQAAEAGLLRVQLTSTRPVVEQVSYSGVLDVEKLMTLVKGGAARGPSPVLIERTVPQLFQGGSLSLPSIEAAVKTVTPVAVSVPVKATAVSVPSGWAAFTAAVTPQLLQQVEREKVEERRVEPKPLLPVFTETEKRLELPPLKPPPPKLDLDSVKLLEPSPPVKTREVARPEVRFAPAPFVEAATAVDTVARQMEKTALQLNTVTLQALQTTTPQKPFAPPKVTPTPVSPSPPKIPQLPFLSLPPAVGGSRGGGALREYWVVDWFKALSGAADSVLGGRGRRGRRGWW